MNDMKTIIEGDIEFFNDDATINKVINIFTVPEEDLETTVTALRNRANDWITVEAFNGCITSLIKETI